MCILSYATLCEFYSFYVLIVCHCGLFWLVVARYGLLWVVVGRCASLWLIVAHYGWL